MIVLNAHPVAHSRVELVFGRRFADLSWTFSHASWLKAFYSVIRLPLPASCFDTAGASSPILKLLDRGICLDLQLARLCW
ncbi:hypothetical protein Pla52n_08380 [Stieleria varia]|uniref:Uncharacterized protein n=1 Tax=Stieleria varia TaxID=2528005 RepID=A0A5C6BAG0_9BACT|nr:hypothetical protein Pla52n_08380 [Stieleria varia]